MMQQTLALGKRPHIVVSIQFTQDILFEFLLLAVLGCEYFFCLSPFVVFLFLDFKDLIMFAGKSNFCFVIKLILNDLSD